MKKKEKKYIAPNEASLKRWIAVMIVGSVIGFILSAPFAVLVVAETVTGFDCIAEAYPEVGAVVEHVWNSRGG